MIARLVGLGMLLTGLAAEVGWTDTAPVAGLAGLHLPALAGPVLLTVTGLDPAQFPQGQVQLDLAMLQAMGATTFATSTIWTEGRHVYTGVLLTVFAADLKTGGARLKFHALNDYAIEMPVAEATAQGPILAYRMDDQPMSVRDKGPIWVIYPFDAGPQFRTDTIYSRSIWQLDRIDVLR